MLIKRLCKVEYRLFVPIEREKWKENFKTLNIVGAKQLLVSLTYPNGYLKLYPFSGVFSPQGHGK